MSVRVLVAVAVVAAFSGCVTEPIKPWQRGHLAEPSMAWSPDPLAATLDDHVYFSKEASSGGATPGAGGCGCN